MNLRSLAAGVAMLALAACNGSSTAVNPVLVQDGNLTIAAMQVLSADAVTLGAPPADVAAINTAISTMQTAVADLQKNGTTPQAFATLAQDEINTVAPVLEKDLKANQTMVLGVALLTNMIPIIVADVQTATKAPTSQQIDTRSKLDAFVHGQRH